MDNKILKVLSSLPIILITLYFIPFLGVCLIILRYFVYKGRKKYITPFILIISGIIVLIPKGLEMLTSDFSFIPYYNDIIKSSLYNTNFINYSKLLLTVGVIFTILSVIFRNLFNKLEDYITLYITSQIKNDQKVSKENDLLIKEKQERAKNTHVVYCPNCGADNIITSNSGVCKYCRRKIEYKN